MKILLDRFKGIRSIGMNDVKIVVKIIQLLHKLISIDRIKRIIHVT